MAARDHDKTGLRVNIYSSWFRECSRPGELSRQPRRGIFTALNFRIPTWSQGVGSWILFREFCSVLLCDFFITQPQAKYYFLITWGWATVCFGSPAVACDWSLLILRRAVNLKLCPNFDWISVRKCQEGRGVEDSWPLVMKPSWPVSEWVERVTMAEEFNQFCHSY